MKIRVSQEREKYFLRWSTHDILVQFIAKPRISLNDLKELAASGNVKVATASGNLDELIADNYACDHFGLVQKAKELQPQQLLVIPPDYRIPRMEVHRLLGQSRNPFLNLDAVTIKRRILGQNVEPGVLSAAKKKEYSWDPEQVIKEGFNYLHDNASKFISRVILGYRWEGHDGLKRYVPFESSIEGSELRAYQNVAYWVAEIPRLDQEITSGKDFSHGKNLTKKEIEKKTRKREKYNKYIATHQLGDFLSQMNITSDDLIDVVGKPFNWGTGFVAKVPSRTSPPRVYFFQCLNVPVFSAGDRRAYSMVWDYIGGALPENRLYQSNRRRNKITHTKPEIVHTPHDVAIYQKRSKELALKSRRINLSPFIMLTEESINFVDNLRYNTVMVSPGGKKRALNETEIYRLFGMKVVADGYESTCTTNRQYFTRHRFDPQPSLVKLVT
jgi:hypothetical protein